MAERENMARRQPKVLRLLDEASMQLYHYTGIGIAGLGMFSDAYDLFSISLVTDLLGRIYYQNHSGVVLPSGVYAAIVGIAFCGAVVGQLVFGWLGDKVGRKPVYGVTLKLMVIFSMASGFSFRGPRENVVATLCFFRFWLGFSVVLSQAIERRENKNHSGVLPFGVYAAIVGIAFCGAVVGQLVFGWLGDKVGRKPVYGITLKLMVIFSMASGFSFRGPRENVVATLCFFRFWLGFSIGGDYPLSATIMSEYANKKTRGAFIAAIFAMQGLGNLVASVVAIIVSAAFNHARAYRHDQLGQADYVWRIILMFGALPAILTYYWRTKMPETARYTALIARNAKQAASDMSTVLHVEINGMEHEEQANELVARRVGEEFGLFSKQFVYVHGAQLVITTVCWLVLDVSFYSLNLFMKDIFSHIGWFSDKTTLSPLERTYRIARTQALVVLCGNLPGYLLTVAFVDRIGRVKIQLLGFTMMSIFTLGTAISYKHWARTTNGQFGFVALYACILFFANFGPNSTTFIIPVEIFPTRLRATCHGISGAGGKVGAIVGVFGFLYFRQHILILMIMLTVCNVVGFVFTWFLPEPKGRSLEELSGETEATDTPEDAANIAAGVDDEIHTV